MSNEAGMQMVRQASGKGGKWMRRWLGMKGVPGELYTLHTMKCLHTTALTKWYSGARHSLPKTPKSLNRLDNLA